MDTSQAFTLAFAGLLLFTIYKNTFLPRESLRSNRRISLVILLAYCGALLALYLVLTRWSADDVRGDSETVLFYFAAMGIGLVMMQQVFRWCGVSVRDDAIERRNPAAACVGVAQIGATTLCFAGSNIGNGPGPEAVAFCIVLSNGALILLWLLLDRIAGVCDTLTIERDLQAGVRIAVWIAATGAVIGASVAGDWISYSATLRDFVKYAWPTAILLITAALTEKYFMRDSKQKVNWKASGALAAGELLASVLYAAWVLRA